MSNNDCEHEWYKTNLGEGEILVWCFKCGQNNTDCNEGDEDEDEFNAI